MKIKKGKISFNVNTAFDDIFTSPIKTLRNFKTSLFHTFFWRNNNQKRWEEETYSIFHKFLSKDYSYIDIGAWIGPTVLYGAQKSKYCYAIEPDAIARNILIKNLRKNKKIKNVTIINKCIADKKRIINLGGEKLGNSTSSIMATRNKEESLKIEAISFGDLINDYNIKDCNFIKMDIEGAESIVLPTMIIFFKEFNVTIMISLHPKLFEKPKEDIQRIIKFAKGFKYSFDKNLQSISLREIREKLIKNKGFDIVLTNISI